MAIRYELCPECHSKQPMADSNNLGFGAARTNHMFVADYINGEWQDARIVPYADFSIAPGALCFHYGQTLFEGGKAFRHDDNNVYAFRFDKNAERLNDSAVILQMPPIPVDLQVEGFLRLMDLDRAFCPQEEECSIYIRPFMFATEDALSIRPSVNYRYCIMLSPSGPYYPGGFSKPIKLLISTSYHRAVSGGTGNAKAGGNYAASMRAGDFARSKGAAQVLYLDASNTYLEEAGVMNHFHVLKDGTFIIPEFTNSILKSITSRSVLELAAAGKIKARQERILFKEFLEGLRSGDIIEAGGFGTAAVISPAGTYILEDGTEITVGDGAIGKHTRALYEMYTGMQTGKHPAPEGWLMQVPHYTR